MKKIIITIICVLLFCPVAIAQEIPDNACGLIVVPCINVTMPLFEAEINDHEHRQAIIDDEESALYCNWGNAYKIIDHVGSNGAGNTDEWYIQKIFSGAYAYLYTNGRKYVYECYMTGKTEYDGNEYINGRLVTPCSSLDIMLSCCAEDSDHHFIAVFRRLKEF